MNLSWIQISNVIIALLKMDCRLVGSMADKGCLLPRDVDILVPPGMMLQVCDFLTGRSVKVEATDKSSGSNFSGLCFEFEVNGIEFDMFEDTLEAYLKNASEVRDTVCVIDKDNLMNGTCFG